jgi:hypothetical protein
MILLDKNGKEIGRADPPKEPYTLVWPGFPKILEETIRFQKFMNGYLNAILDLMVVDLRLLRKLSKDAP